MTDGTDLPGPGDGRRDPNSLPPRQEGGGLPSRHEEGSHNQELQEEEEIEEETYFCPREPSPDQDSSEEELRRPRYGRHRRRGRHHRLSFSPVGKGAAGEVSFPHHMVSSSPQQQSLVSESNSAKLNELLDRSLTEEGLTRHIADLLSTLTGRVQLTPFELSSLKIGSSVPSASSVNTRMTVSDFGAISKLSGNENE